MRSRHLHFEQWLPVARKPLFAFFSDPANLQELTPPWLHFSILTPGPVHMRPGTLIDYRLRLHGIPLRWRTEIQVWEPESCFVDTQLKGPYRLWRHTHRFVDSGGGTLCLDDIDYAVPGGWLIDRLLVQRDVQTIFAYRRATLARRFPGTGEQPSQRSIDQTTRSLHA